MRRRNLTDEQRERLRQNAKKLVAEGRWGGSGPAPGVTWGQGRSKLPRPVPKADLLVAILQTVEAERQPGASDDERRLFASVPVEGLRLDREQLTSLVTASLAAALDREQLPRKAVLARSTGRIELAWNGKARHRPSNARDTVVQLFDPRPEDFRDFSDSELLDVLVLLSAGHVYAGDAIQRGRSFVLSLVRRVGEAATAGLFEREDDHEVACHEGDGGRSPH